MSAKKAGEGAQSPGHQAPGDPRSYGRDVWAPGGRVPFVTPQAGDRRWKVVFPAPERPITATVSPRCTSGEAAGDMTRPSDRLGAVFQDPRLLPARTALENVELVCPADRRWRAGA